MQIDSKESFDWQSKARAYVNMKFANSTAIAENLSNDGPSKIKHKISAERDDGTGKLELDCAGIGEEMASKDSKPMATVMAVMALMDDSSVSDKLMTETFLTDNLQASLSIMDTRFSYGFEYMGNGSRLALTPQTVRCSSQSV